MHFYVQGQIYSMIIFQELLSPFKTNALVHSQNSKKLKEVLYVTVSPQLTTEIKTSSELTELCLGYSAIFTPFFDTYNEIFIYFLNTASTLNVKRCRPLVDTLTVVEVSVCSSKVIK